MGEVCRGSRGEIAEVSLTEPLVYDLCCGLGGWTEGFLSEGYRCIGYDIEAQPSYPGEFWQQDVRKVDWTERLTFAQPAVIVASPPCEQFSRHQMPWTRARNPPEPDLSIVEACYRLAREACCPIVLENVRMAQNWLGRARWHSGSFYLWGDVPALMPLVTHRPKESFSSTKRLERAKIPFELSSHIARCFKPR